MKKWDLKIIGNIWVLVVFVVLAILIGFIELMHFLLKEKTTDIVGKTQTKKIEERISAGVMAEAPEISDVASDGEFIAAVSAAISVYTGKPNGSFKIKSIKKG